jgi:hypothetical protein
MSFIVAPHSPRQPRPARRAALAFARIAPVLALVSMTTVGFAASETAKPAVTLYASPTGGAGDCGPASPCTIEAAKAKARAARQAGATDIVIRLMTGRYGLSAPLVFDAADSGTTGHPVRYSAADGATPVLSGGVPVTRWRLEDATTGIWSAPLPPAIQAHGETGTWPRAFFVNGKKAERARLLLTPVKGGAPSLGPARLSGGQGYAINIPGMADWRNPDDIEIVYTNAWTMIRCPVASITRGDISVQPECWNGAKANYASKYGFGLNWLENNLAFLTQPGQWYLDGAARTIYYKPRPGETMDKATALIASAEQLIVVDRASNISFEGLTLSYTNWYGYRGKAGGPAFVGYTAHQSGDQSALGQQPLAAVEVKSSAGIVFKANTFANLGGSALAVFGGSSDISITGNRFLSNGATGLQIGRPRELGEKNPDRQNAAIVVQNNMFRDNGQDYWDNTAILAYALRDSALTHNDIGHCPWSCVAIGWGWGVAVTYNQNVTVANNLIHHGMERLYDGGGIYMNGQTLGGMTIENNVVENIGNIENAPCHLGYWPKNFQGIYLDEGSDAYVVRKNLVLNIVPADPNTPARDACFGNWLRINSKAQLRLVAEGNVTDHDIVAMSSKVEAAPGCTASSTATACLPGQSGTVIAADAATKPAARSIRAQAGLRK